ncbi:hypothetical protein H4R19_004737 [Coemansia spiralis]|nr:hypothetical protein H4R19_004737 [Coemansia spiralis]
MTVLTAVVRLMRRAAALVASRQFLREVGHLALSVVVFYLVSLWMVTCQQWSDARWLARLKEQQLGTPQTEPAAPWPSQALLFDQVLDHLPVLEQAWISDKLVSSSILLGLVGCSLMVRGWRLRVVLVRRGMWMVAVLYFMRSVTISVTTVPPSSPTCRITAPNTPWQNIKATSDIIAGTVGQCTDKVFSGHTAILTLMLLFWCRYATHWAFIAASATHTAVGILTVLMARYHYTVDVLVGLLLTYFVHCTYYQALERAVHQRLADGRAPATTAGEGGYSQLLPPPVLQKPEDDGVADLDGGAYDMAVFPKTGDDSWRDHDSVLGVDVSGRHTPIDQPQSVVRKRETSAGAPGPDATPIHHHHEIMVVESEHCSIEEHRSPLPTTHHNYHLLPHPLVGVNRPFSGLLPAVVAWMDGLDIRLHA